MPNKMEVFAVTYYALVAFPDGAQGHTYTAGISLAINEAYAYKGAMDACKRTFPEDGNKQFARCWGHEINIFRWNQDEPIHVNGVPYYVQVHQGVKEEDKDA